MSEVYLHQVFSGRRNPSRSRLLCLCFGLNASLEETQELLKQCGFAQLYPKDRRDAIILYGIIWSKRQAVCGKWGDAVLTAGERIWGRLCSGWCCLEEAPRPARENSSWFSSSYLTSWFSKFPLKTKRTGAFCKYCDFSTFEKEKTLKSYDFKVFLHSLELLVEISGIEPLTSWMPFKRSPK